MLTRLSWMQLVKSFYLLSVHLRCWGREAYVLWRNKFTSKWKRLRCWNSQKDNNLLFRNTYKKTKLSAISRAKTSNKYFFKYIFSGNYEIISSLRRLLGHFSVAKVQEVKDCPCYTALFFILSPKLIIFSLCVIYLGRISHKVKRTRSISWVFLESSS